MQAAAAQSPTSKVQGLVSETDFGLWTLDFRLNRESTKDSSDTDEDEVADRDDHGDLDYHHR